MRYHLSTGDGQTYGPFEVSQLQSMAADGRVNATSMLCAEGDSQWVPASSVVPMAAPPTAPAFAPQGGMPNVSLVGPILATLFCCLPLGIVSIVYAANANGKIAQGDLAGAAKAAASSKTWLLVSVVLGLVVTIGWILLYIVAAVAEAGNY